MTANRVSAEKVNELESDFLKLQYRSRNDEAKEMYRQAVIAMRELRELREKGQSDVYVRDAERYRWLKPYLEVARDDDSKWTCWLALQCIPYRSTTESAEELLDKLIERFPPAASPNTDDRSSE